MFGGLLDIGSEGQVNLIIKIIYSKEGVIVEIEISKEGGGGSCKITVSVKVCICCNYVGDNPRSSEFVLKYGLEMLIEWVIRTISIFGRWIRSVGWAYTSVGTKIRLCNWGEWVERWFFQGV